MSEDASISTTFAVFTVHKVAEGYWDVLEQSPMGLATVATCAFESQAHRVAAGLAVLDTCGRAISHGQVTDMGAPGVPAIVDALRFSAGGS